VTWTVSQLQEWHAHADEFSRDAYEDFLYIVKRRDGLPLEEPSIAAANEAAARAIELARKWRERVERDSQAPCAGAQAILPSVASPTMESTGSGAFYQEVSP
jgi:hypothetical protein